MAARLDGREVGDEIEDRDRQDAKDSGLVIVYGASDDLMEFDGCIHDEAYPGADDGKPGKIVVSEKGIVPKFSDVDHDDENQMQKYFEARKGHMKIILAHWCAEPGYSWTYETSIPHATFEIMEDGDHYCRGIVFDIASLK